MLRISRTNMSVLGVWWYTVDRWMLFAIIFLGCIGLFFFIGNLIIPNLLYTPGSRIKISKINIHTGKRFKISKINIPTGRRLKISKIFILIKN